MAEFAAELCLGTLVADYLMAEFRISIADNNVVRSVEVSFTEDAMTVILDVGRTISVPLD